MPSLKVKGFTAEALIAYYEAMMKRPDVRHQLQKAAVPVLFVMGKYDMAVPSGRRAEAVLSSREKSYIHPSAIRAYGMMEEKDNANRILEKFFAAKLNHVKAVPEMKRFYY